ncbi:MAG: hypothetical protein K6A65_03470, partial [Succinivibrionaceae bacterium]|nr:hypothetical protein [Succinivibrionaceae bacterium]
MIRVKRVGVKAVTFRGIAFLPIAKAWQMELMQHGDAELANLIPYGESVEGEVTFYTDSEQGEISDLGRLDSLGEAHAKERDLALGARRRLEDFLRSGTPLVSPSLAASREEFIALLEDACYLMLIGSQPLLLPLERVARGGGADAAQGTAKDPGAPQEGAGGGSQVGTAAVPGGGAPTPGQGDSEPAPEHTPKPTPGPTEGGKAPANDAGGTAAAQEQHTPAGQGTAEPKGVDQGHKSPEAKPDPGKPAPAASQGKAQPTKKRAPGHKAKEGGAAQPPKDPSQPGQKPGTGAPSAGAVAQAAV